MLMMRFQCPECGMGDYEVGHLVAEPVEYLRRLPGRAWPPDPPGVLAGAASSPLARLARRRLSGRLSCVLELDTADRRQRHAGELHDCAAWLAHAT